MLTGVRQVKGALYLREELKGAVGKRNAETLCLVPGLVRGQQPPGTPCQPPCVQGTQMAALEGTHTPGGGKAAP